MDAITLIAERRIAEAQEEGAFDNLPGAGRPLDLDDDSMVPEDLRMACKVLRNAGYLPPQLDTAREIQTVMDLLENCSDEREKYRQMQKLNLLLRKVGASRNRPLNFEEYEAYYRNMVNRMRVAGQSAGNDTDEV
ncbi:DnaJ family domain-containing protein [Nitratidesulfovibrio termitidis]|uniref:DnaJ family domain-containing protein n=1 Tax=Nitratidesulfovibrio termitidis TaxID=42252 RepID=UPI000429D538|nr:DnaJ family domain-containing protein [Nitratidesulfovibrio termitidis]